MEPKWYSLTHVKTSLEANMEKHNITLIIPKFKAMLQTKAMLCDSLIKYSIFQVPNSQFRLKLIFFGKCGNESMMIYYNTNSSITVKFELNVEVSCFEYRGWDTVYDQKYCKDFSEVLKDKWHPCAVLLKPNQSQYERLVLNFVFTISQEEHEDEVLPTKLSEDLGILLTEGSYSDVVIKSADGMGFKAHKIILAIRSAVLKAHFEHNMKESITNIIETPWETEVLRDVLIYVYTGTVPRVDNDPDKLLAAADYYHLQELKTHCETALYKRLTVDNAIETLELAEQFSAKKLLEDTLAFIRDKPVSLIISTEGYSKIQSTSIVKKLYEGTMVHENDIHADILEESYKELGEEFF